MISAPIDKTAQALLDALDGVAYIVDAGGIIQAVGKLGWDRFARQSEAPQMDAGSMIACNLFDSIRGEQTQAVYRRFHRDILAGARQVVDFVYRCDAPQTKRTMRMSISPLRMPGREPAMLYQSQTLAEIDRPWMSVFEPRRVVELMQRDSDLPIVRICSFCERLAWPIAEDPAPQLWVDAEDYYRGGGPGEVGTSHGVCPDCIERLV